MATASGIAPAAVVAARPATSLERVQVSLLAGVATTASLSIFACQLLLAASVVVMVVRLARGTARLPRTLVDAPLLAFAVWTLLSASFADDPAAAHGDAKKLLLFSLFYVAVEALASAEARRRVLPAVHLGGIALAFLMILQFHALGFDQLTRRPQGFLGHYMSSAGVLTVVVLLAAAELAQRPRLPSWRDSWLAALVMAPVALVAALVAAGAGGRLPLRLFVAAAAVLAIALGLSRSERLAAASAALPAVAGPLAVWALLVSQTRSAWLAVLAGAAALAVLRAPKLLAAAAVLVGLAVIAQPTLRQRLTFSDASSIDRYYMWQAGVDMVIDRPVFGQGPEMILRNYPRYRWTEAPNPMAPHLHNNLMQVAAERGIPGLVFFTWWVAGIFLVVLRSARSTSASGDPSAASALGALAVLVGVFAAGMFEYNLGDSEVLMLVLLAAAVPFALQPARAVPA